MRHLLGISDLDRTEVEGLLELAASFAEVQTRAIPKVPALRGKTVVLAFFEDSTRTRTSFDLAARRLSADVVNFSVSSSSTKKGESLRDTVETIDAMGVDAVVVRHSSSGAPHQIAEWVDASVINAGDGWHQHPTQALLDSFTIYQRLGSLDGRKIAICGDIQHSRVARSNVVAYFLRIQQERLSQGLFPSVREYRAQYGLTRARAERLRPEALIMHPGPMNRGVEIDPEVANDKRSVVLDQVSAGVPVRMAVLFNTMGPGQFTMPDGDEL
jgi:aspartate carbamoyltransferase catalytic subunit